jgi:short-chain fatty acids transporter
VNTQQLSYTSLGYRAAGAATYLGIGATWAMGSSSSTARLQANPASIPATLLPITGVIPFSETLFLWQSLATAGALVIASTLIAWWTAPGPVRAKTAADLGIALDTIDEALPPRERPGEWLE